MKDDAISRKAAIELIERMKPYHQDVDDIAEMIDNMPPAQSEIIHCGDCRYWKNNHLCECLSKYGTFETEIYFYCGFAERRDE